MTVKKPAAAPARPGGPRPDPASGNARPPAGGVPVAQDQAGKPDGEKVREFWKRAINTAIDRLFTATENNLLDLEFIFKELDPKKAEIFARMRRGLELREDLDYLKDSKKISEILRTLILGKF